MITKKVGRPKGKAKAKRKVSGLPATKKLFGKVYKKVACSATVTGAKSTAKKLKEAGKSAWVVKNPAGGACTYSRAKKAS